MSGASARSQLLSRTERVGDRMVVDTTAALARIPAGVKLKCVQDKLIVQPLDVVYSRWVHVERHAKPMRGIVLAVGPGHHPLKYFDRNGNVARNRHERSRVEYSKRFQPTQVRVGDVVELGGQELNGYCFEQFLWGDTVCISCTERDVVGVVTDGKAS